MKEKIKTAFIGLLLMAMIVVSGCTSPVSPGNGAAAYNQEGLLGDNAVKESSFKTIEEYQNFVRDNVQQGGGFFYGAGTVLTNSLTKRVAESASLDTATSGQAPAAAGGNGDFSGTNNQVAGVDEADMLKADGEYIYTITDKTVFIIKSYPGNETAVVSKIVTGDYPTSLFVNGDKLAVMGTVSDFDFLKERGFSRNQGYTYMKIYDISDKSSPKLLKDLKFEGQYNNARMEGENVYLVSTFSPEYRSSHPTPVMFDGSTAKDMPVSDIHYFNIPYSNPSLVVVNSINIRTGEQTSSKAITIEGYPQVYMSQENMYVVYTEYINEWEFQQQIMMDLIVPKLSEEDQTYVRKVQAMDSDILSKYEKQQKILQVAERYLSSLPQDEMDNLTNEIELAVKEKLAEYKYREYTIINKLSVNSGAVDVVANGKVPGHIASQFSMDEYKGDFRIATTVSQVWSRFIDEPIPTDIGGGIGDGAVVDSESEQPIPADIGGGIGDGATLDESSAKMVASPIMPVRSTDSTNNLYVLNSKLETIGSIEGLAEGEQIYGVRFMDDRAYVVTFRQVDPFFAIDLRNPSSPEVLGQLKIPGFSRYLHPYDKNIIIGLGQDATETGRQQGLKISLFDVSDVEHPKEIAKYVSDARYSGSTAEYEHKAFLFSKDKNLLVVPIYSYDWNGGDNMNGALVFSITEKSIVARGLIDHSNGQNAYSPSVERSLYIKDMLYTKSPYLLRVNSLDDLSSVKNVTLSTKEASKIPTY